MDWADEKARKWLDVMDRGRTIDELDEASLAALLREVAKDKAYEQWCSDQHVTAEEKDKVLDEVRRVVREACDDDSLCPCKGDAILKRLEKLL